ncbi:IclR family transcriptional regulator [Levilactobacillus namurensis]|uniref:IclR family transcriptional regulator n=1 Tax=Levilactobacillus namurensis TaxID=380393 RepID=UPI001D586603|nr:IclR family transcriptional regulator [Levilactobacillus namurensis]HJE44365.1 IclR family transcriptional regulator [Levilactobacillus namurensis]
MEKKLYGTVLIKASKILDCLAEGESKTIQEISEEAGINAPTTLKILTTLEYLQYVARIDSSKKYYLGAKLIRLGQVKTEATNLVEVTLPFLEQLQEHVDETIHLAIPQGDKVVYVNKLEPKNQGIYMTSKIGMTREMYSSGIGKAVLSTYSKSELQHYLEGRELKPFTKSTITDKETLIKNLAHVCEVGYAVDDEEQEVGGYCIAMPLQRDSITIGAMSVSIPKFRVTEAYRQEIIDWLGEAKRKIENELRN